MTALDINTPKGQVHAEQQIEAMKIVFSRGPHPDLVRFIHFPTEGESASAAVDGFIERDGTARALAEVKSRDYTYEHLLSTFKGEWLISFQKIEDMQVLCRMLRIKGYGFLYLVPSKMVLSVLLVDDKGYIACDYYVKTSTTQRTCNGGTADRENAFVNMQDARIYRA